MKGDIVRNTIKIYHGQLMERFIRTPPETKPSTLEADAQGIFKETHSLIAIWSTSTSLCTSASFRRASAFSSGDIFRLVNHSRTKKKRRIPVSYKYEHIKQNLD